MKKALWVFLVIVIISNIQASEPIIHNLVKDSVTVRWENWNPVGLVTSFDVVFAKICAGKRNPVMVETTIDTFYTFPSAIILNDAYCIGVIAISASGAASDTTWSDQGFLLKVLVRPVYNMFIGR